MYKIRKGKMVILVTGANGQLGLSLQKIAPEYPAHRFVFTDLPEGDITDAGRMEALVAGCGAEAIVNCAAYTAVDRAESDEAAAGRINADGPAVLAELAVRHGCRLIHVSTDYVFDGNGQSPYREEDAVGPVSVYGRTKLAGEERVCRSGGAGAIVRTAWLYSEFGNNFVKTMLRLAGEGRTLRVVDDQYGTPTYATDLARALMVLVERSGEGMELFHYTDDGQTTWYGFAVEIFRQAGLPVEVVPVDTAGYPTAAKRPHYSVLAKEKIMEAGAAVPPWREALRRCMDLLLPESRER